MKISTIDVSAYITTGLGISFGILLFLATNFIEISVNVVLFLFCCINMVVAALLWSIATRLHNRSFNPLNVFIAINLLFYVVMPALASLSGYRFIDANSPEPYFSRIIAVNLGFICLFSLGYILVVNKKLQGNKIILRANESSSGEKKQIYGAVIGAFMGFVAATYLQFKIGSVSQYNYDDLTLMLSGSGWLLRMIELLAISALLFILVGAKKKSKLLVLVGLALLLGYVAYRIQFQNRENALKYIVILFIAKYAFFDKKKSWKYIVSSMYVVGVLAVFALPVFSGLRAGYQLENIPEFYQFFLFRDLNFSEISAAIMNNSEYESLVSFTDSIKSTAGMLIPRALWLEKPQTISVLITSLITPEPYYDIDNPHFAYAPSYFSFFYVVGGYALIYVAAFLGGIILGNATNLVQKSYLASNPVNMLIGLIFVYYFSISAQKLDPANILTALAIPLLYLTTLNIFTKLTLSK